MHIIHYHYEEAWNDLITQFAIQDDGSNRFGTKWI